MPEAGFLHGSGHDPHSRAVFDANTGQWLTRAQLTARVAEFAERLQLPRKALVVVFPFNDSESLIAYLGAVHAGHAVVLLNPELDDSLRARVIARFQPDFIVSPKSHPAPAVETGAYAAMESPHPEQILLRSAAPNPYPIHPDLTLLNSTSGSTGSPKLVRLSWLNLQTSASQINQTLRNSERDRTMVTAPIFNAYGQSIIHTMLAIGGSFVLTRARLVFREFWDAVRETECNTIGGTPYFYEVADRLDIESMEVPRLVKFAESGGRLPGHLVRKFHAIAERRGGALHVMYGQAEATARISGLPPEYLPEASGSIGFAVPGGRLWVERDGCECGPMEEGEFLYEGANVMMGYARCPEDLAKGGELGGRLATGDLGHRDARGLFYITGRTSRFVKLNGWRVSLDEVEELLSDAGPIAAVNENDRLVIYSERPAGTLDEEVRRLASRLNLHPSGFEVRQIGSIPRLANDKVDYGSLARGGRAAAATGSR